jgi:hypothetical protein
VVLLPIGLGLVGGVCDGGVTLSSPFSVVRSPGIPKAEEDDLKSSCCGFESRPGYLSGYIGGWGVTPNGLLGGSVSGVDTLPPILGIGGSHVRRVTHLFLTRLPLGAGVRTPYISV